MSETSDLDSSVSIDDDASILSLLNEGENGSEDCSAVLQEKESDEKKVETTCQQMDTTKIHPIQRSGPDEALHRAVCKALASLKKDGNFPMPISTFYAKHVLTHQSTKGPAIDLKQTTYKKFGPYVLEQIQIGLITAKWSNEKLKKKKEPMDILTGFDRGHPHLVQYTSKITSRLNGTQKRQIDATCEKRNPFVARDYTVLLDLYVIPPWMEAKLGLNRDSVSAANARSELRRGTGMLKRDEAISILESYLDRESLTSPTLQQVLNSKSIHADDQVTVIRCRSEASIHWLDCLDRAHAVVQMPNQRILKLERGKRPKVSIFARHEKDKLVTFVYGLDRFNVDLASFAKDVSSRFDCTYTLEERTKSRISETSNRVFHIEFIGSLTNELKALLLGDETITSHRGAMQSTYLLPKNAVDARLRGPLQSQKTKLSDESSNRNRGSKQVRTGNLSTIVSAFNDMDTSDKNDGFRCNMGPKSTIHQLPSVSTKIILTPMSPVKPTKKARKPPYPSGKQHNKK